MLDIKRMATTMRSYRAMAKMSQDEAAAAAGISRVSLSHYETAKHVPQVDAAWALADVYGCTLDELMGREVKECS